MALRALLTSFLLSATLLIASLALPASGPYVPTHLIKSIVRIQEVGDATYCSGIVINQQKRYVLTADHCMAGSPSIVIQRSFGTEVYHIPEQDASIIQVGSGDPLPPALRADLRQVTLEQQIAAFGYAEGKGMKRINLFVVFPMVSFPGVETSKTPWFIILSPEVIGGMSGGPLFSDKGVIAINMAGRSDPDISVVRPIAPIYAETIAYWSEMPETEPAWVHPDTPDIP